MKIGIFGLGTVGGGVVEILNRIGGDIKIAKICVRDPKKNRDINLPKDCELVTNVDDILEDESIDVVVELMGGTNTAWHVVRNAIEKNKHVVTANKALIAKYLPEIQELLTDRSMLNFGFEAAVGGGIPIIHTLQRDLAADEIYQISGIVNGTTNFILSKMEKEGAAYADVLKEAQDLGFAEADPSADVEGGDARAKISILTKLAFGLTVKEDEISTKGITEISDTDFAYVHKLKSTIKLLAVAKKNDDHYSVFVSPVVVGSGNILAQIDGATNAISIKSQNLQETTLIGQGAGRFPTANAVVSDILSVRHGVCSKPFAKMSDGEINNDLQSRFYIRFNIRDGLGVVQKIGEYCAQNNISINSIEQLPIGDHQNLPFILTTENSSYSAIEKMCNEVVSEKFCITKPFFMPIFD